MSKKRKLLLPTAVIFDMDGVIVDSEPLFDRFLKDYCKKLGIHLTQRHLESYRGKTSKSQWTDIINEFSIKYSIDDLIIDARKSYLNYIKIIPIVPIPGVVSLVRNLSTKRKLILASSASPHRITIFLEKTKLKSFFPTIVSADDVVNGKPAPDIFLLAAKKAAVKPKECLVIEDATNGILAAKKAGMKVLGFTGISHNTQDLSDADIIIKKFNEVTENLLQRMFLIKR